MRSQSVVPCIRGTTELDFDGQGTDGLGPLNYKATCGLYLHPTYAMTTEREPLDVLDPWMWASEELDADGIRSGPKESARWVEGYERVAEMASDMPGARLVYVADRETDMVELMCRARERILLGEPLGEITFVIGARESQKSRTVRQQLWGARGRDRGRPTRSVIRASDQRGAAPAVTLRA